MKLKWLTIASLVLVTACSSNAGKNEELRNSAIRDYIATNSIEDVKKVTTFRYSGWSELTNDFLIVSSSPRKQFLVEMTGGCFDLKWANAIILKRSESSSLQVKFDSISTADSPQITCRIDKIYPITGEQEDEIIALRDLTNEESK